MYLLNWWQLFICAFQICLFEMHILVNSLYVFLDRQIWNHSTKPTFGVLQHDNFICISQCSFSTKYPLQWILLHFFFQFSFFCNMALHFGTSHIYISLFNFHSDQNLTKSHYLTFVSCCTPYLKMLNFFLLGK